jgi:hypothetical protein
MNVETRPAYDEEKLGETREVLAVPKSEQTNAFIQFRKDTLNEKRDWHLAARNFHK